MTLPGLQPRAPVQQQENGVGRSLRLAQQVAATLGVEFDIEVVEMHHKHKIDAPSGTALMLGKAAAQGRGIDHDEHAVLSREGHTGARPEGAIGYATLRGGDVVGDHTVVFAGPSEDNVAEEILLGFRTVKKARSCSVDRSIVTDSHAIAR